MKQPEPDISWSSDRSLRIVLGDAINGATHRRVVAAWNLLRNAAIPDVVDVVPAYATVQVVVDPLCVDARVFDDRVRSVLQCVDDAITAESMNVDAGRMVEIPVCYGGEFGPDLGDVAAAHGMDARRVIELHSSAEYRVQFVGFAPGFAYLAGLPREIHTERLAMPRRRVEAGSVGIAGGQTGVYPQAAAGGWRIIGRTARMMFGAARTEASVLQMGDRVRFVQVSREQFDELAKKESGVREQSAQRGPDARKIRASMRGGHARMTIVQPGLFSTVQDDGRFGHASIGVAPCGAADGLSLQLGNRSVGNADDAAGIEMTLMGCTVEFDSSAAVAVTGADAAIGRDGSMSEVKPGCAFTVAAGERLKIAATRDGARCYLSIAGGVLTTSALGSRATHVSSGIGGPDGRALRAGDVMRIGAAGHAVMSAASTERAAEFVKRVVARRVFRVTAGMHAGTVAGALEGLVAEEFEVQEQSDRSGIRLASLLRRETCSAEFPRNSQGTGGLITEPMLPGFVQWTPSGQAIVLGVDGPTTGGYPVIAAVVSADLCALGQARPRDVVRFELIPIEAARPLARAQRRMLDELAPSNVSTPPLHSDR